MPKRPRTETTQAETTQAETTQGWNDSGPKRPENAVAVVAQERTCRVVHLIIWLSIFVPVRIFWTSNIFVIIVFPYTHDTGAVTGTEPGYEFYTLTLIEINIAAFQPFNTTFCIRDVTEFWTSEIRWNDIHRLELWHDILHFRINTRMWPIVYKSSVCESLLDLNHIQGFRLPFFGPRSPSGKNYVSPPHFQL